MEASPFARLSAELRNQIWSYALYQPGGFYLDRHDGNYELSEKGHHIALIKTCRQINAETTLLLYNVNKFIFNAIQKITMRSSVARAKDWLRVIGPAKASAIAEICFDFGQSPRAPRRDWYKEWVGQIFGDIREALYEVPPPCKSLTALTAGIGVPVLLDDGEHLKMLTLELPLTDEAEAIRRVEETFQAERDGVMQRLKFYNENVGVKVSLFMRDSVAAVVKDDCAELDMWKGALICAIKQT